MKLMFGKMWSQHQCDIPDCKKVLVGDGNMKLTRKICAAKFNEVIKYVLTGCTSMPSSDSIFCSTHKDAEQPVIPTQNFRFNVRGWSHSRQFNLTQRSACAISES